MAPFFDLLPGLADHGCMFVRQAKRKDKILLQVVENVRVNGKIKQKFICGLGTFRKDETEAIKEFTEFGEEFIIKEKNKRKPCLPGMEKYVHGRKENKNKEETVSIGTLVEEARIKLGPESVYGEEYRQMGLFDSIGTGYKKEESNKLLEKIVLERIENPCSKRESVDNIRRGRNEEVGLGRVYRMMDKLGEREEWVKEKIARDTIGLFAKKVDVAFFDVTTLYFESFTPDELRVSGYSKDNKVKETQVVLALMTTREGLPLGYELYPGNIYEGKTLIAAVENLAKRYDISDTFIVADRGMFNNDNLAKLEGKGIKFIISAKLKNMSKKFSETFLEDVGEALSDEPGKEYWIKSYDYRGKRLVVSYSKKRAAKDRKDREKLVKRIEDKMTDGKVKLADLVKNRGTTKYLKLEKKNAQTGTLDLSKIGESEKWDGIYGYMTNSGEEETGDREIVERYRGLWQVEDAFRVNKHDLKMRPIYHWTEGRIRSHILICFMAYSVAARVRWKLKSKGLKMSVRAVQKEMSHIQASILRDRKSKQKYLLPSALNKAQKDILSALGVTIDTRTRKIQ